VGINAGSKVEGFRSGVEEGVDVVDDDDDESVAVGSVVIIGKSVVKNFLF